MIKVHKIQLKINNKQKTYCAKASGISRFAYNWALNQWNEQYKSGKKPTESKLRKQLNSIKKEEFPWMYEVTKVAPQQGIKNLGEAFKRFFKKQSSYPKYKKKYVDDSFRADNGPATKGEDAVKIEGKQIKIPVLGWVKLTERLRFKGQIKSVVISRIANCWYAAISVDVSDTPIIFENQGEVGVDLGITTLAIYSTGTIKKSLKPYNFLLKRVRLLQKKLSRAKKKGKNREKIKTKLAKLHARIANIRIDMTHKITFDLVKNFSGICIENLNVRGMLKNRKLSRHIMDCNFYEFSRQLKYKCQWYARKLVIADRFFASSKICNNCNHKNIDLKLADRRWECPNCHKLHNRDLNAALNLLQYFYDANKLVRRASPDFKPVGEESAGAETFVTA